MLQWRPLPADLLSTLSPLVGFFMCQAGMRTKVSWCLPCVESQGCVGLHRGFPCHSLLWDQGPDPTGPSSAPRQKSACFMEYLSLQGSPMLMNEQQANQFPRASSRIVCSLSWSLWTEETWCSTFKSPVVLMKPEPASTPRRSFLHSCSYMRKASSTGESVLGAASDLPQARLRIWPAFHFSRSSTKHFSNDIHRRPKCSLELTQRWTPSPN